MIILLYGACTYRLNQKLNEIKKLYQQKHKNSLDLKCFDDKASSGTSGQKIIAIEDLKNDFQQSSMFKGKKLFIVKGMFDNKKLKEEFLENVKIFLESEDIILLFQEGKIPSSGALLKFLKRSKNVKICEFKPLEAEKLRSWTRRQFKDSRVDIEPEALKKLIDFVGNNLWRMSNEIKKIISFKGKGSVSIQDIETLIEPKIDADIFKTIDAIALRDKKQALKLIREHLEKGDYPLLILSMINFQFRNIVIIKDMMEKNIPYGDILRKTKLHPFVVRKSCNLARKFSKEELKKIYQDIFKVDFNIKTGKIEPQTALDILIAQI